jgi:hypothetical protein
MNLIQETITAERLLDDINNLRIKSLEMIDYKCDCGRLLFRGKIQGIIEIKCQKCKKTAKFIL